LGTGSGGYGRKRNGLSPPSGAIYDSENVCVALRGRKRTEEVYMDVGETMERNGNGRRGDMCVNTLFSPGVDILGNTNAGGNGWRSGGECPEAQGDLGHVCGGKQASGKKEE
jgi:hypothetical protein